MDKLITITQSEYDSLVEDSEFLLKLRGAGVDNWDGYYLALRGEEDCD